eukprot:scaffold17498_cov124-Skeletonema_dohrnii-CCMP3373.AAC.1
MEGAMSVATAEERITSTHLASFMRMPPMHTKIVSSALLAITSRRTGPSSSTSLERPRIGTKRLTKIESLRATAVEIISSSNNS